MKPKAHFAYLLIAHGTRDPEGRDAFFKFVEEFRNAFPSRHVEPAFLELSQPSIREGIDACVAAGAEEIFVMPLMLFPGRHVKEDIPREIQEAKRFYPEIDFHYTGALALASASGREISEPKMFELLLGKISRFGRSSVSQKG